MPQANPKIFTLDEANAVLPLVREALPELRRHVTTVLAQEAKADAWELIAGAPDSPTQAKLQDEIARLEQSKRAMQEAFEAFEALGAHLKDLDIGLIDFYTMIDGELALLCWHEGEERVSFWHTIEGGYAGRQPIPD